MTSLLTVQYWSRYYNCPYILDYLTLPCRTVRNVRNHRKLHTLIHHHLKNDGPNSLSILLGVCSAWPMAIPAQAFATKVCDRKGIPPRLPSSQVSFAGSLERWNQKITCWSYNKPASEATITELIPDHPIQARSKQTNCFGDGVRANAVLSATKQHTHTSRQLSGNSNIKSHYS